MREKNIDSIDASIELLEERLIESKKMFMLTYFMGAILFIAAFIIYSWTFLIGLPVLLALFGIFCFTASFHINSYRWFLYSLIYFKRNKEMK